MNINTAVVLTTFAAESRAVTDLLDEAVPDRHEERGTVYEVGTFTGRHSKWTVAVAEIGPGNSTAAVQLERAGATFEPEAILLVGVAGGVRDVALGDVVVADAVYEYRLGKDTDAGCLPRLRTQSPSHRLLQLARLVARHRGQGSPRVLIKPIAAGDTLVAGTKSATAKYLRSQCGDAVAVEMEGGGFLRGAYLNRGLDTLVVRGISDLLRGKNPDNDRHWQPIAASNAAAFALAVLDAAGDPASGPGRPVAAELALRYSSGEISATQLTAMLAAYHAS